MKRIFGSGTEFYEILTWQETAPDATPQEFPDELAALAFLSRYSIDESAMRSFRAFTAEELILPDLAGMEDREVLAQLAHQLRSGHVRVARLPAPAVLYLGAGAAEQQYSAAAAGAQPVPARPKPPKAEPEPKQEYRLALNAVSHHFAPSSENADIDYSILGLAADKVTLEISSDSYPNNPIYRRELTAQEKTDGDNKGLPWDGKANGGGLLQNRYVTPLYAPYKVKLLCDRVAGGQTAVKECLVLYHSIKIQDGTYTPDDHEPDGAAEPIRWLQYKLNKLGYFAGSVDNVDNAQLRRAIKRYTYAMPGFYGNAKSIDDPNNAKLGQQLAAGEGSRQILEGNRFPEDGDRAKGYIDHDFFFEVYDNGIHHRDFLNPQGHRIHDSEVLDRFEYPLEVKVYLVAKNDPDGSADGVEAPQAVGPVDIEWSVEDTPEVTAGLPAPGNPSTPSRTRNYVEAALAATRGGPDNANDNCPATNISGLRPTPPNHSTYFRAGNGLPPFTSEIAGNVVYSPVHDGAQADPNKIGRAGILFRGSYIAGDTYKVKAKIAFTRHEAGNHRITQSHRDFADQTDKTLDAMLAAGTGELVLWRRHHLAAVVNWPDPGRPIDVEGLARMYEYAFCELVTDHQSYAIQNLFDTNEKRNAYLDAASQYWGYDRQKASFKEDSLWPVSIRVQGPRESSADYKIFVNNLVAPIRVAPDIIGELISREVAGRLPAGSTILRAGLHSPVGVRRELCLILRALGIQRLVNYCFPGYYTGDNLNAISAGLIKGVALLENIKTAKYKDIFIYSHELAHCRYLKHCEAPVHSGPTPEEHDQNDHNCIMSYAESIQSRPGLDWSRTSAEEPRFCGKCVLKLRGWNVRDATLPAQS